jgi:hypothetical protein
VLVLVRAGAVRVLAEHDARLVQIEFQTDRRQPLDAGVFGVAVLVAIPHLIQDDGHLLSGYARTFKRADIGANPGLAASLDQSFHLLALFLMRCWAASRKLVAAAVGAAVGDLALAGIEARGVS